ncbi:hypothetical protein ERJ70_18715 [Sediminibacillus dalangtanensis]|uniref:Transposase n=1 Tax=Sediminibacillus dalangtanensis TaxID=2729421 RepID=A0ABX7VW01_9BACI|nr:transposase [Sediminibacillus dalangtanensis]QTN01138.1 hypothetical protein ERJ70_18715 [Sediminibacillus dalangtanensis]
MISLFEGHDYGTLLCNLDTHEPVDILENREEETVRQWFRERPRQVIHRANPSIIQISDRFHLVHNLGSLLERILMKELPAKIKKYNPKRIQEKSDSPSVSSTMGYAERKREENAWKKWEVALEVKKKRRAGIPYQRIGRKLNLHRTTVKKYEEMKGPPDTRRTSRSTAIQRFLLELEDQVKKGYKTADIEAALRAEGYEGSYSAVRNHVEAIRRKAKNKARKETIISRKQAWVLFWRPLEALSEKEREALNHILSLYPKTKG